METDRISIRTLRFPTKDNRNPTGEKKRLWVSTSNTIDKRIFYSISIGAIGHIETITHVKLFNQVFNLT